MVKQPGFSPIARRITAAAALLTAALVTAQQVTRRSLSTGTAPAGPPTTYPALAAVPDPAAGKVMAIEGDTRSSSVNAGTLGRKLPLPATRDRIMLAILGPVRGETDDLKILANDLKLLRPDLVLTTGDLLAGFAPDAKSYAAQVADLRIVLDSLKSPWYPCVGERELASATLDPRDRRLEGLYESLLGPRFYSVDLADLHVVVLDSQERTGRPAEFSAGQLDWLRQDLKIAFERRHAQRVIVVTHRPAWRQQQSNWARVHEQLVAFNRRPIVTIEGTAGGGGVMVGDGIKRVGPRVEIVFAADENGCVLDGPQDGIAYHVIGPATAAGDRNVTAGRFRQFALVDVTGAESQVSIVEAGHIFGGDLVLAADRQLLAQVEGLDPKVLGLEGALEQPFGKDVGTLDLAESPLRLLLGNPLKVPIDVDVDLASPSRWQMAVPNPTYHLAPGERTRQRLALKCEAQAGEVHPPQIEFRVHVKDSKGRELELPVNRRLSLVPYAAITPRAKLDGLTWNAATAHGLYAFEPAERELLLTEPLFYMAADATSLHVRVRVEGNAGSYVPKLEEPWALPMDAVTIAWATGAGGGGDRKTPAGEVQRIVVLPFAPEDQRLLTNTGVGVKQTALTLLDRKQCAAKVTVLSRHEFELELPREAVFAGGRGDSVFLNVGVFVSRRGAPSEFRSWAREEDGPAGWGEVRLIQPPAPASQPLLPGLPLLLPKLGIK